MIQLFIEGHEVDIHETISVLLTLALDDIKNFGSKETTYSKTFVLPGTKNNNLIFANIFEITTSNEYDPALKNVGDNFNVSVSASAYLFQDNIQCFKGILRLMEIIIDDGMIEYEVSVFGELGGFILKLGANKLTDNLNTDGTVNTAADLDFSAYDHSYTVANIAASWDNAAGGSGYYYPSADYGSATINDKHSWQFTHFRPALFVKEYAEKIFQNTGYTIDFPLLTTARFMSLYVPHNQKKLQKFVTTLLAASRNDSAQVVNSGTPYTVPLPMSSVHLSSSFTSSVGDSRFTFAGTNAVSLLVAYNFTGTYKANATAWKIELQKNGVAVPGTTVNISLTGNTTTFFYSFSGSVYISFAVTDYLEVVLTAISSVTGTDFISATNGTLDINSDVPVVTEVPLGDFINVNQTIPKNILQKDFISSIVKLFNLYVFDDPTIERHLIIKPFVDFFSSAASEDWSNKVDRSKVRRIRPMSELSARYYAFNYKDDSDYWNDLYKKRYNESYGSFKYDSAYQLVNDSETVEIIFSGTPLVGYLGEDKVYSAIYKKTNDKEEPIDSNIRILQAKKITGVSSWDILDTDGTTVLGSYTDYGYGGHLDDPDIPTNDLNFGVPKELFFLLSAGALNVNQFNVYYSSYLAEITHKDARMLTCTVKLDYKDIYNLDFSKYKWIDGALYRLNRISDFNVSREETCVAEFIKLISKIY